MIAPESDARFMQMAVQLAMRGAGQVAPNPLVGAVVVQNGVVVGEGWHAHFGGDHAEVMALRAAGSAARGATLYVTLEPCRHDGKTPPCTTAIVHAGIARVVYAVNDPNPVAGGGGTLLRTHGVDVTEGVGANEAREQNAVFLFARTQSHRPFVTVKLGMSIDGAIVDQSRKQGWITGPASQEAVHALRAQCDAVGVGIETVLADDPLLTVRYAPSPRRQPVRVVFDRHGRLPATSKLVQTATDVPVIVVRPGAGNGEQNVVRLTGVEYVEADSLQDALQALRSRDIEHLLVEGGATLVSAFFAADLVDRLITFQAPVVLGEGALSAFARLPARAAQTAPRWRVVERREFGADLMTKYAVSGD